MRPPPAGGFLALLLLLSTPSVTLATVNMASCEAVPNPSRLDCHPEPGATEAECLRRNCCWSLVDEDRTIACYFPDDYPTYVPSKEVLRSACSVSVVAKRSPGAFSVFPDPVDEVKMSAQFETQTRVRIRITDTKKDRWEPDVGLAPPDPVCPSDMKYTVGIHVGRLGFSVYREGEKEPLVSSGGLMASAFVYSDQFLQMAFQVKAIHGYGLGEREDTFPLVLHEWKRMAFWARDDVPRRDTNLYGTHPFFMGLSPDGTAFGMFFLNSNAMEITKQPLPSLTYRTTGGILDFFVFVGPTPNDVVAQYYQLIGHPPMPPYWALGFQLCRYGYTGVEEVRETVERNRKAGIPQDVQWMDIEYMDRYRDWTLSKTKEYEGLTSLFNEELPKKYGIRNVLIIDAAIPSPAGDDYKPYKTGLVRGVFVNDSRTGKPLRGIVWPGDTVFPDFTKNETIEWWYDNAKELHEKLHYDGIWIDMDEPANFVDGCDGGCDPNSRLDHPPYTPWVSGGSLSFKTICPSALHDKGVPHYNIHNIYGHTEAMATRIAMDRLFPGKKHLIVTRSSFAGTGKYASHWSGDVVSSWAEMAETIPQMINFNMYGMPFFGADICGFMGNTTEELCVRWSQLGAFYPFSRNHNTLGARLQDPAVWSEPAQKAISRALNMRYQLLPYLYNLLYESSKFGKMTAKALAFDYPADLATHHIDKQFLLGSCLLVAPVMAEGMRFIPLYLPKGEWVEFADLKRYKSPGRFYPVSAPLDKIPVFYKAGCVFPMHPEGAMNTVEARKMGIGITVVLLNGTASGNMIWDDGVTENGQMLSISFEASEHKLTASANIRKGERDGLIGAVPLAFVRVIGVSQKPSMVKIDDKQLDFVYEGETLTVDKLKGRVDLKESWNFIWN